MNEVATLIKAHKRFGIFTHTNPDGDALGSAYALAQGLRNLGGSAEVVLLTSPPKKYEFPAFDPLYVLLKDANFDKYDAHIAVDCAVQRRLGVIDEKFRKKPNANIDHHISNTNFANANWVEAAAATGELVYDLLMSLGAPMDQTTCMATYIAISTDTGNFTFSNTTSHTLEVFEAIMKCGLELPAVANQVFNMRSAGATRLIARFIENMRFHYDGKMAISTLMLKEIEETGARVEDCESLINYARDVDSVEVAVFLREMCANTYKISLRSKDYVDVADFAGRFDGGGHLHASGYKSEGNIHDVMQRIIKTAGEYLE